MRGVLGNSDHMTLTTDAWCGFDFLGFNLHCLVTNAKLEEQMDQLKKRVRKMCVSSKHQTQSGDPSIIYAKNVALGD